MKKLIIYCLIIIGIPTVLTGQQVPQIDIQKYDYTTEDFNYSRINLYFLGATMPYEMQMDSSYRLEIMSTMLIKKGEDIVRAEKHRLTSQASYPTDFTDSHELSIEPGEYTIEYIVHLIGEEEPIYQKGRKMVVRDFSKPGLSDLMLLQSFKEASEVDSAVVINGVRVEILPFSYVPEVFDRISYFFEFYPGEENELFLLEHIDKYEKGQWNTKARTVTPLKGKEVISPMFKSMNIADIESGEYRLAVDLITRSMDTLASTQRGFIRANPLRDIQLKEQQMSIVEEGTFVDDIDHKGLRYNLKAIAPLVPETEVVTLNYVLRNNEERAMRVFLYNFWRNYAPVNTDIAYEEYMKVAEAVDFQYNNGMGYGFETDRGRVFLQYGRPTQIVTSEQEIASVPYEIWSYDYVERTRQSNVRFIFYNPSLVPNGYELLHSTARGEIENPRWELYIYQHAPDEIDGRNFMDSRRMQDNINRNARRHYEDN